MANDIRPYGPGKFSTIVDSYVYSVSLDGGADEEYGDANAAGWYGLMRNGSTIFRDHDPFLESLNEAESDLIKSSAGVIISEDSQGFVHVEYFDETAALEAAWDEIARQFEADEAAEDEPQEDDITTEDHEKFYQSGRLVIEQDRRRNEVDARPRFLLTVKAGDQRWLDTDDYRVALRTYMELTQYWPACWFISDHGNAHLIELTEVK